MGPNSGSCSRSLAVLPTKPERGRLFPALSDEMARSWTSGPCLLLETRPVHRQPYGSWRDGGAESALSGCFTWPSGSCHNERVPWRWVWFLAPRSRPRRRLWRRGPLRTLLIIRYSPPVRSRCPAPPMRGDEERQTGPVSSTEYSRVDLRFRCKGMSWKSNNSAKISSPACLGNTYMPTRCRGLACTR